MPVRSQDGPTVPRISVSCAPVVIPGTPWDPADPPSGVLRSGVTLAAAPGWPAR